VLQLCLVLGTRGGFGVVVDCIVFVGEGNTGEDSRVFFLSVIVGRFFLLCELFFLLCELPELSNLFHSLHNIKRKIFGTTYAKQEGIILPTRTKDHEIKFINNNNN